MSGAGARTALVSGASRGIGLETARALAAAGLRVGLVSRSADELRHARRANLAARAIAMPCDVADDAAAVQRLTESVDAAFDGPPDVIVNNAGAFKLSAVERTEPEDFRRALDVNLVAPFLLTRAFVGAMRARGHGHIVTIGSVADRTAFPENGAYAASKFGARALHEVLRAELRGSGVRATLVSPSAVDTSLWDPVQPDTRPGFTPRNGMLRPEAVAAAVSYVVSQPAGVNVDELRLSHT